MDTKSISHFISSVIPQQRIVGDKIVLDTRVHFRRRQVGDKITYMINNRVVSKARWCGEQWEARSDGFKLKIARECYGKRTRKKRKAAKVANSAAPNDLEAIRDKIRKSYIPAVIPEPEYFAQEAKAKKKEGFWGFVDENRELIGLIAANAVIWGLVLYFLLKDRGDHTGPSGTSGGLNSEKLNQPSIGAIQNQSASLFSRIKVPFFRLSPLMPMLMGMK